MKDLILITIIFLASLTTWFLLSGKISNFESQAQLDESIAKFTQNSVTIDLQYLKDIPAYESK